MKYIKSLYRTECFMSRNKKEYFEGWYFKNVFIELDFSVSFIPGVCKNKMENYAFIQVIHSKYGTFDIKYDIDTFEYSDDPFYIKIGNNFFSKEKMIIDIESDNNIIKVNLNFNDILDIKRTPYMPNIMGPFAYLKFLECNHGVISLHHKITGDMTYNNDIYTSLDGNGYIEKDWGISFPEKYIWLQCNNFKNLKTNLSLAIATVPISKFTIKGCICIFYYDNKEYRFSTYNLARVKNKNTDDMYNITLSTYKYILNIQVNVDKGNILKAPDNSKMKREIYESLSATVNVSLFDKSKNLIARDYGIFCGLEIVE